MTDGDQEVAEAKRLALRAAELGGDDADALVKAGYVLARVVGELEGGIAYIDRALALNPNLATAWHYSGWTKMWQGRPEAAIQHLATAMRLSPLDRFIHHMQAAMALAHFGAGRYDEASIWAEMGSLTEVTSARVAAASNALAGRIEKAHAAMAHVRQLDPDLRISNLKDRIPTFWAPEVLARYEDGLRKAGLSE
jgi:tetratricopeptide (TPR) repeat protein